MADKSIYPILAILLSMLAGAYLVGYHSGQIDIRNQHAQTPLCPTNEYGFIDLKHIDSSPVPKLTCENGVVGKSIPTAFRMDGVDWNVKDEFDADLCYYVLSADEGNVSTIWDWEECWRCS